MWGNHGGYDGGGYDHGGGYVSSQGDIQGGSNQEKKKSRNSSILPCTVGQLLKAEQVEDKFVCEGIELNQISLVGLVRASQESPTNHLYEIDDMTGPVMEVRIFVDNDENTPDIEKIPLIPENNYVYICGHLRSFSGKKNVTAFKLRRVTDLNEITSHMFEVVHAHLYFCKGAQPSAMPTSSSNVPQGSFMSDMNSGLTPIQSRVLDIIRSCQEERGMTIAVVSSRMGSTSSKEIENALEFLSNEGHIYSTIDDTHFRATDNC